MAKVINVERYQCQKCSSLYNTKLEAEKCESKEISQDKGVKVGDIVIITSGDGQGSKAKVTSVSILDINWGHYAWERYWHTVVLQADIIGSYGSRQLTFDSYKL